MKYKKVTGDKKSNLQSNIMCRQIIFVILYKYWSLVKVWGTRKLISQWECNLEKKKLHNWQSKYLMTKKKQTGTYQILIFVRY